MKNATQKKPITRATTLTLKASIENGQVFIPVNQFQQYLNTAQIGTGVTIQGGNLTFPLSMTSTTPLASSATTGAGKKKGRPPGSTNKAKAVGAGAGN